MLGDFDSHFVWSELMQKELQFFYPSVKNKHIKIVGTPQFEPYVMERYYRNKVGFDFYFSGIVFDPQGRRP